MTNLREIVKLDQNWKFCTDPDKTGTNDLWYRTGIPYKREVSLPHTFNVESETETYYGDAWYEYTFPTPASWKNKCVRIVFKGVYRDADFWINGQKVFQHYHSGYTAFEFDITEFLTSLSDNRLVIRVNNEFSEKSIPIEKSFDWSNDGGIFREVLLLITSKNYIDMVKVDSLIYGIEYGIACHTKDAEVTLRLSFTSKVTENLYYSYQIDEVVNDTERKTVYNSDLYQIDHTQEEISSTAELKNVKLWHFDHPHMYSYSVKLYSGETMIDEVEDSFGVREFIAHHGKYFLNGEPVRLVGTEWMPGSNPSCGSAESLEDMTHMLQLMKDCNCIFTRFHWQQDEAVFHWCDTHGMLVQEEIPNWGAAFAQTDWQFEVSKKQFAEMIRSHYNHPSIVSWGIANELNGQDPQTKSFLGRMIAYCKTLDRFRMINYISNTMWEDPVNDAAHLGDTMWVNDYIWTWHGDLDMKEEFDRLCETDKNKLIVISEFGLCEPAFSGGDARRIQMFHDKMDWYEKYPQIGAVIHFCLNDYRTQMGEEGSGKNRKRVHGTTDLYGQKKESFYAVQKRFAPVTIQLTGDRLYIQCKDSLPAYSIKDYHIQLFKNDNTIIHEFRLPELYPGEGYEIAVNQNEISHVNIYRPNNDPVYVYHLS